jgi:outer membrane protein OmpA-like peptidoglycan-associated protein
MAPKTGFCNAPQGCTLADARQSIAIDSGGKFHCPECGQDLWEIRPPKSAAKLPVGILLAAGAGVILIASGLVFGPRLFRRSSPEVSAAPVNASAGGLGKAGSKDREPKLAATQRSGQGGPAKTNSGRNSAEGGLDPGGPLAAPPPASVPPPGLADAAEIASVKKEVLTRIDLIPNVSTGDRRKLYTAVERSQGMRKVAIINFDTSKTAMTPKAATQLATSIQNMVPGRMRDLISDPTTVMIVLGYADTKGNEKANVRISTARAESVARVLRTQAKVSNMTRVVGMGASSLFDSELRQKNRLVEVWAVIP